MSLEPHKSNGNTTPLHLHNNVHPFEEHLLALEGNLKAKVQQAATPDAQATLAADELAVLRHDLAALKQTHGGCVSAIPGEVCEHCLSVVKVRLHMLLERDRRGRRLMVL